MTYDAPFIEQPGLVTSLTGGRIKVALQGNGDCATSHDALCMLGKSQARWVEAPSGSNSFNIGDAVMVRINRASGYAGLLWLYVVPFFIMVLTLIGIFRAGTTRIPCRGHGNFRPRSLFSCLVHFSKQNGSPMLG